MRVFHLGMKPRNAKEVEVWNDSEVMPDLIPYSLQKHQVFGHFIYLCHLPSHLNAPHPYAGQYSIYVGIHAI